MHLIDIHCHLNHDDFKKDLDQVIEKAKTVGLKVIIVSGTTPEGNKEVLQLAEKYPGIVKASLGIYPIDALGMGSDEAGLPAHKGPIDLKQQFQFIRENLDKVACIGEVGMDFYFAEKDATASQQEENFRKIVRFAISIKKPLVIHSRKAEEECINILAEEIKNNEIAVIMHCFSGRKSLRTRAEELGYYFSVPPHIVKASNFQTLVRKTDIKRLLTETDAPWLSPVSGVRNEPANVTESIRMIAEVKELSEEEVAKQIWENYQNVFNQG